jgi:hypothetical protein
LKGIQVSAEGIHTAFTNNGDVPTAFTNKGDVPTAFTEAHTPPLKGIHVSSAVLTNALAPACVQESNGYGVTSDGYGGRE